MPELKLIRLTCLFFVQFPEGNARNTIDLRDRGRPQRVCAAIGILLTARSVGRPIVEIKETDTSVVCRCWTRLYYLTRINWSCCSDSINSENGIRWMTNVTASVAARLLPDMKSRWSVAREARTRCVSSVPPRVAIPSRWIGPCRLTKRYQNIVTLSPSCRAAQHLLRKLHYQF